MAGGGPVRAAGGVVCREAASGGVEVLLVHRPRYDDWSFPKGKCAPGERYEDAALREVEEETGFVCRLGDELGTVTYRDRFGRPKVVRYWAMTPSSGRFVPNHEVDEVRWMSPGEATAMLTYERDTEVLSAIG